MVAAAATVAAATSQYNILLHIFIIIKKSVNCQVQHHLGTGGGGSGSGGGDSLWCTAFKCLYLKIIKWLASATDAGGHSSAQISDNDIFNQ